jgi:hypothetical protein
MRVNHGNLAAGDDMQAKAKTLSDLKREFATDAYG